MRQVFIALAALALTSCGSGISGEFGGAGCIYNKITFKPDGTAYIDMGVEQPAQYKVDGDRVSLTTADGSSVVFIRNGNSLELSLMGKNMWQCTRL